MLEDSSVAERNYGDWKQRPWDIVHDLLESGQVPPNGESFDAFVQRVVNGLANIFVLPERPVLIVTHGGVFDALLGHFRCKVADVQNCHLYEFSSAKNKSAFPWKIERYEFSEDGKLAHQAIQIF